MTQTNFDLIVIGAGPGGIEAALYAAQKNRSVALVSATKIGGRATWGSLIPSKVWLASAEKAQSMTDLEAFAFHTPEFSSKLDLDLLRKKVGEQSTIASNRYLSKLEQSGVVLFYGTATVQEPNLVKVEQMDGNTIDLTGEHTIIASGSGPRFTPDIKPNKDQIIAPKIAPGIKKIPDSMVMAGGGVTGTEYAYAFAALGTKITILQNSDQLLPRLDEEISHLFETHLTSNLPIEIKTQSPVTKMEQVKGKVMTHTRDGRTFESEYGFIAIGRKADLSFFDPGSVNIQLSAGDTVKINQFGQTSIPNIYAIGDVTGAPMTANRATMQARVAVEHIINGNGTTLFPGSFIEAVYTNPSVAQIGNMNPDAESYFIKKEYKELLKSSIRNKTEGILKLKIDKKSNLIRGASGFGVHIPDLMASIQLAMNNNLTFQDLNTTPFAYPSVSELITNI